MDHTFVAGVTSTGLGLGLYLADRIAKAHHGRLTIDSLQGQGRTAKGHFTDEIKFVAQSAGPSGRAHRRGLLMIRVLD